MPTLKPINGGKLGIESNRMLSRAKIMTKAPELMEGTLEFVSKHFDSEKVENETQSEYMERRENKKLAHALMHKIIDKAVPTENKLSQSNGPEINVEFGNFLKDLAEKVGMKEEITKLQPEAEYEVEDGNS